MMNPAKGLVHGGELAERAAASILETHAAIDRGELPTPDAIQEALTRARVIDVEFVRERTTEER